MDNKCKEAALIEINTYGYGYYSKSEYNEVLFITPEDFLKYFGNGAEELTDGVMRAVAGSEQVGLGELDGKHSEVFGDIECETWSKERVKNYYEEPENDGDFLRTYLMNNYINPDSYEEEGRILKEIQNNVNKVLESIKPLVEVHVRVPKEKVEELRKFAERLCK